MKLFSTLVLATALCQMGYAGDKDTQAPKEAPKCEAPTLPDTGLDQEELDVYQADMEVQQGQQQGGKTEVPEQSVQEVPKVIVIKIDTKTGERKMMVAQEELAAGVLIKEEDLEEVELWDGKNIDTGEDSALVQAYTDIRWGHNRSRGLSVRHRYNGYHPYSPYYGRHNGPIYSYPRYYDRPHRFNRYPYRPYYRYWVGDAVYGFFRRALD